MRTCGHGAQTVTHLLASGSRVPRRPRSRRAPSCRLPLARRMWTWCSERHSSCQRRYTPRQGASPTSRAGVEARSRTRAQPCAPHDTSRAFHCWRSTHSGAKGRTRNHAPSRTLTRSCGSHVACVYSFGQGCAHRDVLHRCGDLVIGAGASLVSELYRQNCARHRGTRCSDSERCSAPAGTTAAAAT